MKIRLTIAALLIAPLTLWAQTDTVATSKPKVKAKTTRQAAAPAVVEEAPLTDDQLGIANRVTVGQVPCEAGERVNVEADAKAPGYFFVGFGKLKYHMHPVESRSGAVRLEDAHTGAFWLQLGNKSMLMNPAAGKRLADDCINPAQMAVAEALKSHPVNLLGGAAVAQDTTTK